MLRSLRGTGLRFHLTVLCLDDEVFRALSLLQLPGVEPLALAALEAADPELFAVKSTRTRVEYYFTCTGAFARHLLVQKKLDEVTYVDADLWFAASPQALFDEMGDASVAIIGHRFPAWRRDLERFGRFNVGWLTFRNDERGRAVLERYRAQCIDWCYDRIEGDRYADQKYLDSWPQLPGVCVLQHIGANVAPWNVDERQLHRAIDGALLVGDVPLLFYHFHGFKELRSNLFDSGLARYAVELTAERKRLLYAPYAQRLLDAAIDLKAAGVTVRHGSIRLTTPQTQPWSGARARLVEAYRQHVVKDIFRVEA